MGQTGKSQLELNWLFFLSKHILLQHAHPQQEKENKVFDMNLLQEPAKLREGKAEED